MPPSQPKAVNIKQKPEGDHANDPHADETDRGRSSSGRPKDNGMSSPGGQGQVAHANSGGNMEAPSERRVSMETRASGPSQQKRAFGSLVTMTQVGARNVMQKYGWYESPVAVTIRLIIRSKLCRFFIGVLLMVALFLPDIFAATEVATNLELDIILTAVLVVFVCEFFVLSLTDASYLFCFFFWMDILGTLSLLFNISYLLGEDVTKLETENTDSGEETNIVVLRAARSAKFGARAGRIGRVMKLLQFLPFMQSISKYDATAKVIGMQLGNMISTRVAFLALCMVVLMPLFSPPRVDESMMSWTRLIDMTYMSGGADQQARVSHELQRFADFYADLWHGPYKVCLRPEGEVDYLCGDAAPLDVSFKSSFHTPQRPSQGLRVTQGSTQAFFDLSRPFVYEALGNMGLTVTVVSMMVSFCLVVNSNISFMLLPPLDRMLTAVRSCCRSVFQLSLEEAAGKEASAANSRQNSSNFGDQSEDFADSGQTNEFELLELAVLKITAIAGLSLETEEPKVNGQLDERDMILQNFTQGWHRQLSAQGEGEVRMGPMRSKSRAGLTQELRPMLSDVPEQAMQSVGTPSFDALTLSQDHKVALAGYIVLTAEGSNNWTRKHVPREVLAKFLSSCEATYVNNPFHNFAHGLDVMHFMAYIMTTTSAEHFLPDSTQFWPLIAAVAHDAGHLGVNNLYLAEVSHELAVMYNDQSPLENMHCAKLFEMLKDPGSNVFRGVDKNLYKEIRMSIIDAILHTDMTKHNELVKDASMFYQMNSGDESDWTKKVVTLLEENPANKQMILNVLLHAADINNPAKPWELCHKLALLCLQEFFAQGDMEKAAGIPVQMLNDRDKVNIPNSQIGFVEFVITPLMLSVVNIFPSLYGMADRLGQNIQRWCEMWEEEQPAPDALAKVHERVAKVVARCKEAAGDQKDMLAIET
mmetsp:Transcript_62235/g.148499  ORF Transcript_62235/g.148499 Transcript_62235/m.148499 type:complete len:929 (+) Transcript_62235:82-2868(+)